MRQYFLMLVAKGHKSKQALCTECRWGKFTVQYSLKKRGCNQPESVELLVSWLMSDAKGFSSFVLCLWSALHGVPTGEKTLAGLQMPRCRAAPPAHSLKNKQVHAL